MKQQASPLQTLDSKVVYSNPWITVHEDAFLRSNGSQGIYGYMDSKPGVFAIAVTEDDKIYLVESFRYPTQKWQWELPQGGVEKHLTPLESAKQELAEEAGLIAKEWTPLGAYGPSSNGFMNDTQYIFVARKLHKSDTELDGAEAIRGVKTVSVAELMNMIKVGALADGQSLASLMLFVAQSGLA